LVPDAALPAQAPAPVWVSNVSALSGKGMWVWEWNQTDGGSADAVVRDATQRGLHQLWVRVADSQSGFYGGAVLDALVGKAHAAGLKIIGWGFPYLYDPVADAGWTAQALSWHDSHGEHIDGFSADIERSTEGVDLTEPRVAIYLGDVRSAAGSRLIVATVYPPTDAISQSGYPYAVMARYVDAFAPMVYWGCTDPATDAARALSRLATLRPVHLIGQAYNMAADGGRTSAPSADEIRSFLDTGLRGGAVGASFWDWQSANDEDWRAIGAFSWR
jgi:hypothetical protein